MIDVRSRKRLLANGIRAGIVTDRDQFQRWLKDHALDQDVVDDFFQEAEIASYLPSGARKVPMAIGRKHELPLAHPKQGEHVVLASVDGETIGRTLLNPQFLFSITPNRSGKKRASFYLDLQCEIQHGDVQQRFVSSDTAMRIDSRRQTWELTDLNFLLPVRKHDLLVIGPTEESIGIGTQMFRDDLGTANEQKLLLIRVARTPHDTTSSLGP